MGDPFAVRLNRLFALVYPPGRGPYSSAELSDALQANKVGGSRPYISQLRTGRRERPSPAVIEAISAFFRVDVAYFVDDEFYRAVNEELDCRVWADGEYAMAIASRVVGLSERSRQEVIQMIDDLYCRQRGASGRTLAPGPLVSCQ
mgnify:CR=1 FL=1